MIATLLPRSIAALVRKLAATLTADLRDAPCVIYFNCDECDHVALDLMGGVENCRVLRGQDCLGRGLYLLIRPREASDGEVDGLLVLHHIPEAIARQKQEIILVGTVYDAYLCEQ